MSPPVSRPKRGRRSDHLAQANRLHDALDLCVLALVAALPLLLGGAHPSVQAGASLALVVLCVLGELLTAYTGSVRRPPLAAFALLAFAGWQLLRGSTWSAPLASDLHAATWALWPEHPLRATLTPAVSPLAALQAAGLAAAALIGARRFSDRERAGRLVIALVLGAVAVVGLGLAQMHAGVPAWLGLYQPLHLPNLHVPLSGSFVNANQAGSFVALAGIVALVAARHTTSRSQRAMLAAVGLGAGLYSWAVGAMGATLAWAAAVGMLLVQLVLLLPRVPARVFPVVLATSWLGWVVAWWWGIRSPALWPQRGDAITGKLQLWHDVSRGVFDVAGWQGIGSGGFADVAGRFVTFPLVRRFSWVESTPLQVWVDAGWLVGTLLMLAVVGPLVWRVVGTTRRRESVFATAAVGVGTFALVDTMTGLSGQAMAVAVPLVLFVGACTIALKRQPPSKSRRPAQLALAAAVVLLSLTAALSLPGMGAAVADIRGRHLGPLAAARPEAPIDEQLQRAAATHPGSPALLVRTAHVALERGDLDRAQRLGTFLIEHAPTDPQTWALQVRLARSVDDDDAVCAAIARQIVLSPYDVRWRESGLAGPARLACAPTDAARAAMYRYDLRQGQPDQALATALRHLREAPTNPISLAAAMRAAIALEMPTVAVGWVDALVAAAPDDVQTWTLAVDASRRAQDLGRASALMSEAARRFPQNARLRLEGVELLLLQARTQPDGTATLQEALTALEAVRPLAVARPDTARQERLLRARVQLALGDFAAARTTLTPLVRNETRDIAAVRALVAVEEAAGDAARLRAAAAQLLGLVPNDPAALRLLETEP